MYETYCTGRYLVEIRKADSLPSDRSRLSHWSALHDFAMCIVVAVKSGRRWWYQRYNKYAR
jgi:hypothetical protein